jgi:hypothetical protein
VFHNKYVYKYYTNKKGEEILTHKADSEVGLHHLSLTGLDNPLFNLASRILSESHLGCASYNYTVLKNIIRDMNEIVNTIEHCEWIFQRQRGVNGVEVNLMLVLFVIKLLVEELTELWVDDDYVFHITNISHLVQTNKEFFLNLC